MKKRLIMTLLVRDEEDILERNICFHLNHGVDFIVAIDNGSRDSTPQILDKFKKLGRLSYRTISDFTYQQSEWVSSMAREAVDTYGATHLFHVDADEFWYPKFGNLKDYLPGANEIFFVPLINYLPKKFGNFTGIDQLMVAKPFPVTTSIYESDNSLFLLYRHHPKIMTTNNFTAVSQGNHGVATKENFERVNCVLLHIHHFPIRSYSQFKTKVINGGSAYKNNPEQDPRIGWHWKRWYKSYLNGSLAKVYRALCLNKAEQKQLLIQGVLVKKKVPWSIVFSKQIFWGKNLLKMDKNKNDDASK